MKLADIKIGKVYRIVGNKGGCGGNKCINCKAFPEHLIKVTEVINDDDERLNVNGDRMLNETTVHPNDKCSFSAVDLELLKILNWKKVIER